MSIEGLTVTAGLADGSAPVYPSSGGGILNLGSLTLDEVVVDGNQAVGDPNVVVAASAIFNSLGGALGGGIENFGTLQVTDSTISNNQALGADNADGSSLPFPSFPGNALGGGIGNFGAVSVEDSTFEGNLAQAGNGGIGAFAAIGGGGAIVNDDSLTVEGTSFVDNQAVGGSNSLSPTHNGHALGGGIMSGTLLALLGAGSATLTVSDSTFSHNLAQGGNDNQVTDAFVPRSDAPDNAYGGGILVYQGSAAISSTTLTKNQAIGGTGYGIDGKGSLGVGGGIFFYNFVGGVTASVDGSTISDNNAIGGDGEAGVEGGDGLGGGIAIGGLGSPYTGPGSVTISNTTVTKNLAQGGKGGGGADAGDGLGGGLFSDTSSTVTLISTTITKNKAKGGRGRAARASATTYSRKSSHGWTSQGDQGADPGVPQEDPQPDQHAERDRSDEGLTGPDVGGGRAAEIAGQQDRTQDGGLRDHINSVDTSSTIPSGKITLSAYPCLANPSTTSSPWSASFRRSRAAPAPAGRRRCIRPRTAFSSRRQPEFPPPSIRPPDFSRFKTEQSNVTQRRKGSAAALLYRGKRLRSGSVCGKASRTCRMHADLPRRSGQSSRFHV